MLGNKEIVLVSVLDVLVVLSEDNNLRHDVTDDNNLCQSAWAQRAPCPSWRTLVGDNNLCRLYLGPSGPLAPGGGLQLKTIIYVIWTLGPADPLPLMEDFSRRQ